MGIIVRELRQPLNELFPTSLKRYESTVLALCPSTSSAPSYYPKSAMHSAERIAVAEPGNFAREVLLRHSRTLRDGEER